MLQRQVTHAATTAEAIIITQGDRDVDLSAKTDRSDAYWLRLQASTTHDWWNVRVHEICPLCAIILPN